MEFTFENTIIVALLSLTGLSSGLCFIWSNTITTGIGHLSNFGYLSAFQQMNKAIINPLFIIVFFGPFLLGLINLYTLRNIPNSLMWLLILAIVIYFFGVILITIFGNVPLNEMLDKTDLNNASFEELKSLREQFENKWNRLHLVRTITSNISFLLLIITFLIRK